MPCLRSQKPRPVWLQPHSFCYSRFPERNGCAQDPSLALEGFLDRHSVYVPVMCPTVEGTGSAVPCDMSDSPLPGDQAAVFASLIHSFSAP